MRPVAVNAKQLLAFAQNLILFLFIFFFKVFILKFEVFKLKNHENFFGVAVFSFGGNRLL